MKLLLDTHIFLWYIADRKRLPPTWLEIIEDPRNQVLLSVVSVWEIIIKYQIGKLPLPEPPELYLPRLRRQHQMTSLPVDEDSVSGVAQLPLLHNDPFDRLLIAQAIQHNLTLVTVDAAIRSYPMVSIL